MKVNENKWKQNVTFVGGNEKVNFVSFGVRPALDDGRPQLDVGLVHLARLADVDLQVLADQREQRRREVNLRKNKLDF